MFKPMLAATDMPEQIQFPVFASYKIDGVRAMIRNGVLVSRALKPIPNYSIQDILGTSFLEGLDGELAVGSPTHPNLMQRTTSGTMSREGNPDFKFFIFDICTEGVAMWDYSARHAEILNWISKTQFPAHVASRIHVLDQTIIHTQDELDEFERDALALGFEGVICRSPNGRYKHGRSTAREGIMFKVKRFIDGEARIIDMKERMHNANEATLDAMGHTVRSSHKDNKIPMGTLGALVCEDVVTGQAVDIGTGFSDELRAWFWQRRKDLQGRIVKYKSFPHGVKDAPRHPVYLGFRDERDMSLPDGGDVTAIINMRDP